MSFLSDVFGGIGRKTDKGNWQERIEAIKKIASQSRTGRQVIDEAYEKHPNLKIRMRDDMPGALGCYNLAGRTISLNAKCSDEALAATLVHEARHACQNDRASDRASLKSMVMANRVCEADAMAFECAAACEIGGAVRDSFNEKHGGIVSAYETAMEKTRNKDAALGEAFKAWFDNHPYVSRYDRQMFQFARQAGYAKPDRKLSPEQIIKSVLPERKNGGTYLGGNSAFLNEPRFCSLTKKALLTGRFAAFFCMDKSVRDFYVEQKDGTAAPQQPLTLNRVVSLLAGGRKER